MATTRLPGSVFQPTLLGITTIVAMCEYRGGISSWRNVGKREGLARIDEPELAHD